jgi:sugar (pentulose or hexulose) kinase
MAQVYTAGGGSKNPAWLKIRENKLGVPVVASTQVEAAYGSALLAQRRAAMPVS